MTREEMIDLTIKDLIDHLIDQENYFGLEGILLDGWKGYDNCTDQELREEFAWVDESRFNKNTAKKIRVEKKRLGL